MTAARCSICNDAWQATCAAHLPVGFAGYVPVRRESECRLCPAYVVRCAHFEGDPRVVWLIEGSRWYRNDGEHNGHHSWFAYRVGMAPPAAPDPESCGCPRLRSPVPVPLSEWPVTTDTRAEADAAFERFEALLLGREPEPADARLRAAIARRLDLAAMWGLR